MGRTKVNSPDAARDLLGMLGVQEDFLVPLNLGEGDPQVQRLRAAGKHKRADQLAQSIVDTKIRESGLSRGGFLAQSQMEEQLGLTEQFGSRLLQEQARLRNEAIEADPLARMARDNALAAMEDQRSLQADLFDQASGGLEDLDNDGLPDDIARNAESAARQSLAARGITESGSGAIVEAMSMVGARERLRSNRLSQASAILSGSPVSSGPGLMLAQPQSSGVITGMGFNPNANTLTGLAGTALGVQGNLTGMQSQFRFAENQQIGEGIGQLAGMGLGGLSGAGMFGSGGFGDFMKSFTGAG